MEQKDISINNNDDNSMSNIYSRIYSTFENHYRNTLGNNHILMEYYDKTNQMQDYQSKLSNLLQAAGIPARRLAPPSEQMPNVSARQSKTLPFAPHYWKRALFVARQRSLKNFPKHLNLLWIQKLFSKPS